MGVGGGRGILLRLGKVQHSAGNRIVKGPLKFSETFDDFYDTIAGNKGVLQFGPEPFSDFGDSIVGNKGASQFGPEPFSDFT